LEWRRFGAQDTLEPSLGAPSGAIPGAGGSCAPNLRHSLHEFEGTDFVEVNIETSVPIDRQPVSATTP